MDAPNDGRRFLTVEDVFGNPEGVDDEPDTPFYEAFDGILASIVTPIFAEVYPDLTNAELVSVKPANNNVLKFSIAAYHNTPIHESANLELGDLMAEFVQKKQQILNGIQWAIYPTMRASLLEQYDLSEEQFLVRTVGVDVIPRLAVLCGPFTSGPDHFGVLHFRVTVIFSLTIEDISTMEPGGVEAVRLRLESLCSPMSRYPLQELRDWAQRLGSGDHEGVMTREELCQFVRERLQQHL